MLVRCRNKFHTSHSKHIKPHSLTSPHNLQRATTSYNSIRTMNGYGVPRPSTKDHLNGNSTSTHTSKHATTPSSGHPLSDLESASEWHNPGPRAYDFHSDTITTPTLSMLTAISQCTLSDAVYTTDPTTHALESHIATLTGHEAGLLVMSGTMGNQVSIRSHLTYPPHSVLCDVRSHIGNHEAGGISTLSGAHLITVHSANKHHLTLEDIESHVILSDDVHVCPTRIISLENTLNGLVMPLSEVKRISAYARKHKILLHLDGARIWEACASGAGSLIEYCSLFDSVSLCLSKGVGAPIGSIIVGNTEFITQAKRIRKMFGGATRQSGIIAAAARVALDEQFGSGPNGEGGRLRGCHERARRVGKFWEGLGGNLVWPVETNMVWLDLKGAGVEVEELARISEEEGLSIKGGRLVFHSTLR